MIKLTHKKKPSRKEAFQIIMNLKRSEFSDLHDNEIDSLINYFAQPIPKIAKTAEQWVCKAINEKESRGYLRYMFVENGVAYGSDGSRLHWCNTTKDNGFYDPKTLLQVNYTSAKYPDMKRLTGIKFTGCLNPSFDDIETVIIKGYQCYLLNAETLSIAINSCYLDDAVNGLTKFTFKISNSDYIY